MIGSLFSRTAEAFETASDSPFESVPFASAYMALTRGIEERAGLMALIGVAGSGKSTLLRTIQGAVTNNRGLAIYRHLPLEGFEGLLGSLLKELRITPATSSRVDGLGVLAEFLGVHGFRSVLLVDDVHRAPNRTLLGLARLAASRLGEPGSLQVIIAGEPELEERLRKPELDWVAAHLADAVRLGPLLPNEIEAYVVHRLAAARAPLGRRHPHSPFTPEGLNQLRRHSDGVPGTLNRLCGCALSGKRRRVDAARVDQAAIECGLATLPVAVVRPMTAAPPPRNGGRAGARKSAAFERRPRRTRYVAAFGITAALGAGLAYQLSIGGNLRFRFALTSAASDAAPSMVGPVFAEEHAPTGDAMAARAAQPPAAAPAPEVAAPRTMRVALASMQTAAPGPPAADAQPGRDDTAPAYAVPDSPALQSDRESAAPIGSPNDEAGATAPEGSASAQSGMLLQPGPETDPVPERQPVAAQADTQPLGQGETASQPLLPESGIAAREPALPKPGIADQADSHGAITGGTAERAVDRPDSASTAPPAAAADAPPAPPERDQTRAIPASTAAGQEPAGAAAPVTSAPPVDPATAKAPVLPEAAATPSPGAAQAIEAQSGSAPRAAPARLLDSGQLMARGDALLQSKDPASARLFFERAAAQGHRGAMSAVGRTFDPIELDRLGVVGSPGNPDRALEWYRRAAETGEPGSPELVARLEERMARRQRSR